MTLLWWFEEEKTCKCSAQCAEFFIEGLFSQKQAKNGHSYIFVIRFIVDVFSSLVLLFIPLIQA